MFTFTFAFPTTGRCNNLVLLSHSSATLFAAPLAAKRAGKLALLGSYIFPSAQAFASLSEWSRCGSFVKLDEAARSRVASSDVYVPGAM